VLSFKDVVSDTIVTFAPPTNPRLSSKHKNQVEIVKSREKGDGAASDSRRGSADAGAHSAATEQQQHAGSGFVVQPATRRGYDRLENDREPSLHGVASVGDGDEAAPMPDDVSVSLSAHTNENIRTYLIAGGLSDQHEQLINLPPMLVAQQRKQLENDAFDDGDAGI
jgi:hypothetical protein